MLILLGGAGLVLPNDTLTKNFARKIKIKKDTIKLRPPFLFRQKRVIMKLLPIDFIVMIALLFFEKNLTCLLPNP